MSSIIKCLSDVWCIVCINSKDFLLIDKDKKVSKRKYSLQVQCIFYQRESTCFFFENTKTSYNKGGGGAELPTKLMNTNKRKLYDTCPCYVNYCLNTFT